MKRLVIALSLLYASRAQALEPWTTADTAWEAAFLATEAVDMMQTLAFRNKPVPSEETNMILGPRPSNGQILAYNAGTMLGHAVIARILPQPYRRIWQATWIGVEAWQVGSNIRTEGKLALAFHF